MWKCEEDAPRLVARVLDNASVLWFHYTAVQLCTLVWNARGLN